MRRKFGFHKRRGQHRHAIWNFNRYYYRDCWFDIAYDDVYAHGSISVEMFH